MSESPNLGKRPIPFTWINVKRGLTSLGRHNQIMSAWVQYEASSLFSSAPKWLGLKSEKLFLISERAIMKNFFWKMKSDMNSNVFWRLQLLLKNFYCLEETLFQQLLQLIKTLFSSTKVINQIEP